MEEGKMTTYFEKLIKESGQKDMEDIFLSQGKKKKWSMKLRLNLKKMNEFQ